MRNVACTIAALLAVPLTVQGELRPDAADVLRKAAGVVRDIRAVISPDAFTRARCVAVIPSLNRKAFVTGSEQNDGVLSCRAGDDGWSAPVFVQLAGGGVEFKAAGEEVDVLLLVMNEGGVQQLMRNRVALGEDVSIVAGPVNRDNETPAAEILAYSRANELVTGLNLSGGTIRPDAGTNREAYGPGSTPATILASRSISAPTEATPFIQALGGASAAAASPQPAAGPNAAPVDAPDAGGSDLRTRLLAMQEIVDRMLADSGSSPGDPRRGDTRETVPIDRERLEQLRNEIEAMLAALNAR